MGSGLSYELFGLGAGDTFRFFSNRPLNSLPIHHDADSIPSIPSQAGVLDAVLKDKIPFLQRNHIRAGKPLVFRHIQLSSSYKQL
jgi:hypothetical protein